MDSSPASNNFASIKDRWKANANKHGSPLPGRIRRKQGDTTSEGGQVPSPSSTKSKRRHSLAERSLSQSDDLDKPANVDLVDQVSPKGQRRNNSFREPSPNKIRSPAKGESIREILNRFDNSFRENGDGDPAKDLVILEESNESLSTRDDCDMLHESGNSLLNKRMSDVVPTKERVRNYLSPSSPKPSAGRPKVSSKTTSPQIAQLKSPSKGKGRSGSTSKDSSSASKKHATFTDQQCAIDDSSLVDMSTNEESSRDLSSSSISSVADADLPQIPVSRSLLRPEQCGGTSPASTSPTSPTRKKDMLRSTDHERRSTGTKKKKKDDLRHSDHGSRSSGSSSKTKEERKSRPASPKKKKKKPKEPGSGSELLPTPKPAPPRPPTSPSRPTMAKKRPQNSKNMSTRRKQACIYQQTEAVDKINVPRFDHSEAEKDRILQALYNNHSLTSCRAGHLSQLVSAFEPYKVPAGEIIVEEGGTPDYMFVVDSGLVEITAEDVHIMTGSSGDSFGELSLLYDTRRATTILALEDCRMFRLHIDHFKAILAADSRRCLQKRRRLLQGIRFFAHLSSSEAREVSETMTPRVFSPGSMILKKGDVSDSFFVLADGQIQRTVKTAVLRSGDYFGEYSMVSGKPVDCDYRAISDCLVFVFERKRFTVDLASSILKVQDAQVLARVGCLGDYDTKYLLTLLKEKLFSYGDNVYVEKESAKACLYIVRSGSLTLRSSGVKDTLGPGASFGEAVLQKALAKSKKSAKATYSVTATEKCVCAVLSIKDILEGPPAESSMMETPMSNTKNIVVPEKLLDLEKHSILGQGAFGRVWLVSDKKRESAFALKIQSKSFIVEENQVEAVIQEKVMLGNLKHPFLINLHRTYQDKKSIYFLMDYVQGGELFSLLHGCDGSKGLPEKQAKFYALSLADVLRYLHRGKYVYRGTSSFIIGTAFSPIYSRQISNPKML